MTKKQKTNLTRIIIAAIFMLLLRFLPVSHWVWMGLGAISPRLAPPEYLLTFVLYLIPYLIVGYDVLLKAVKGVKNLQPFDEYFLMVVATIGAIALALYQKSSDYTEAIAVMLFYQIGEWFQSYAVGKSRKDISDLMDICPDYANLEKENGQLEQVDPDDVEPGTTIVVQPGEKIPIDGVVTEGADQIGRASCRERV